MPLIAAKRDLTKRSPRCSRFPVGSVALRCLTTARPRVSPAFAMLRRGPVRDAATNWPLHISPDG